MDRLQSLTLAAAALALFAAAPGCIHVHTDADGKMKSVEVKGASGKGAAPAADTGVQPAAATVPVVPAATGAAAGLAKLAPKLSLSGGPPAAEIAVTWQNKLAQLPDPARGGAMGTGIVGQMFLFAAAPKMPFALADGKLVVELFDESPRPGGVEPVRIGGWTVEKDVLRRSVTSDERFGKCYALFLPWPTYTPAVTRVRLTVKYEPESGFALYTAPTTMTIDTTVGDGSGSPVVRSTVPAGALGPVVMPANPQPAAPAMFPAPIPIHPPTLGPAAPAAPTASGVPPGLPPISITLPTR